MYQGLLVVSVIGMVASFIGVLIAVIDNVNSVTPVAMFACAIGFFFSVCGFAYCCIKVMKNEFIERYNRVKRSESDIAICKKQYDDMVGRLEALVDKFFSHEKGLVDVVKGRELGNLSALLENYPDLKAMKGAEMLIKSLVQLRDQISREEKWYNKNVKNYNNYAMSDPYKSWIPEGMEKRLEYITFG